MCGYIWSEAGKMEAPEDRESAGAKPRYQDLGGIIHSRVEDRSHPGGKQPECACGWVGSPFAGETGRNRSFGTHLGQVRAADREAK